MSLFRFLDGPDGGRSDADEPVVGREEIRPGHRSATLAVGTLACAQCDAPVSLAGAKVSPADSLTCPFCLHEGAVRDFLSLGDPTRPARVVVRLGAVPAYSS